MLTNFYHKSGVFFEKGDRKGKDYNYEKCKILLLKIAAIPSTFGYPQLPESYFPQIPFFRMPTFPIPVFESIGECSRIFTINLAVLFEN